MAKSAVFPLQSRSYPLSQINLHSGKRNLRRQPLVATPSSTIPSGNKRGRENRPQGAQHDQQASVPVVKPNQNDVLCGRGGLINSHEGNIQFRKIVSGRKREYNASTTKRALKAEIASSIVEQIRNMDPPGRFLKEQEVTGLWYDVGDAKAIRKAGQALREDAPDIRSELEKERGRKESKSKKDNDSNRKNEQNVTKPQKKKRALDKSDDCKDSQNLQESSISQKRRRTTTAQPSTQWTDKKQVHDEKHKSSSRHHRKTSEPLPAPSSTPECPNPNGEIVAGGGSCVSRRGGKFSWQRIGRSNTFPICHLENPQPVTPMAAVTTTGASFFNNSNQFISVSPSCQQPDANRSSYPAPPSLHPVVGTMTVLARPAMVPNTTATQPSLQTENDASFHTLLRNESGLFDASTSMIACSSDAPPPPPPPPIDHVDLAFGLPFFPTMDDLAASQESSSSERMVSDAAAAATIPKPPPDKASGTFR